MTKISDAFNKQSEGKKNIIVLFLFSILIALVYGKTTFFDYCIDDQYYDWLFIERNSSVLEYLLSLRQRFWGQQYRPITFITMLLESFVFGKKPSVFHFFNLIYYVILCFSIYKVLLKYFKKYNKQAYMLSLLTVVLFLLHPSHANVISSIKNRECILSFTFGIWALYFWLKYEDTEKLLYVVISALVLIIGIFAKSDVITFVGLMPLIGFLYSDKKFNVRNKLAAYAILIFLVAGIKGLVLEFVAYNPDFLFEMYFIENPITMLGKLTFIERLPSSVYNLMLYEKFMFWPKDYFFYFGYDTLRIVENWTIDLVFIFIAHLGLLLSIVYIIFCKPKLKKGVVGFAFFFVAIAPFTTITISGIVAVRYAFIASLGFCIILAQLLLLLHLKANKLPLKLIFIAAFLFIVGHFAYFSYIRSLDWKNIDTLYEKDLPKLKRSVNANRMACYHYYHEGIKEENKVKQEELFQRVIKHADDAMDVFPIESVIEYKALALLELNNNLEAKRLFEALLTTNFNNLNALNFLSYYNMNNENYDESISYFERLIDVDTAYIDAIVDLVQLYNYKFEFNKSLELNKRLEKMGANYDAQLNYGDIYIAKGDTLKSLEYYERAIDVKQEDFIIEEILRISRIVNNQRMVLKLESILQQ